MNELLLTVAAVAIAALGFRCRQLRKRLEDALSELHEAVRLTQMDLLTGLVGQNGYRARIAEKQRVVMRMVHEGRPAQLIGFFFDIDDFKRVNDTYGHEVGDAVLKRFAALLRMRLYRPLDEVYRRSGDEFIAVFVTEGSVEKQRMTYHALRSRVLECTEITFPHKDGTVITVTASVGVAFLVDEKGSVRSLCEFLEAGDASLYRNKLGEETTVVVSGG